MEMVNFNEINFADEYEKVHEDFFAYSAKHELLHEMIREFYSKGDFESETVKYLNLKLDVINVRLDIITDVQRYLSNLKYGAPFHVKSTVGRYMVRYGLTEKQATLFLDVHRQHMKAVGTENQKKYSLPYVQDIKWDEEEQTVNVYYEDVWWHYDRSGNWW